MEPVESQLGERASDTSNTVEEQRIVKLAATPDVATALGSAALVALRAPSVHNTQPWHWRVRTNMLELHADEHWQLKAADPDARLLMLSCGAALHHARVALRAMGHLPAVRRFPEQTRPGLLAVVSVDRPIAVTPRALEFAHATMRRRTNRQPWTDATPPEGVLTAMRQAAGAEGAWLHLLNPAETTTLLAAAEHAERAEFAEPDYRRELAAWTDRPEGDTAGVPGTALPPRGAAYQANGAYAVLYGSGDRPSNWLRAGEALSAIWLTAVIHGLAVRPISSVVEVPAGRATLHQLLSGVGCPYLAVRIGYAVTDTGIESTPRRAAREAINVERPADTADGAAAAGAAEWEPR